MAKIETDINSLDSIQFRTALDTDVDDLSQIHIESFQGYLNTSVGIKYTKATFKWFINTDSALVLVCYNSQQIVGYAMGAPDGYSGNMAKALFPNILWGVLTHPKSILHPNFLGQFKIRIKNLLKIQSAAIDKINLDTRILYNKPTYALVGLAVAPEFRGSIITFQLLNQFENYVWRKNFKSIRLTVYKFNVPVIRLYKYTGWKMYSGNEKTVTFVKTKNN